MISSNAKSYRDYQEYWDCNIDKWGQVYLDISHGHERFSTPGWFTLAYHASIGPIERRLMVERYERTTAFIDSYVKPGMVFSDLGCGTGIFVIQALRRGAKVNAVDFSSSAIEMTRQNVARYCPTGQAHFQQSNVQVDQLPPSDVTLAMGLTPYLDDLSAFLERALPKTKILYCLYVDPAHWANRFRTLFPFFNVRGLRCYAKADVDKLYVRHGWDLKERRSFATGYIDLAVSH